MKTQNIKSVRLQFNLGQYQVSISLSLWSLNLNCCMRTLSFLQWTKRLFKLALGVKQCGLSDYWIFYYFNSDIWLWNASFLGKFGLQQRRENIDKKWGNLVKVAIPCKHILVNGYTWSNHGLESWNIDWKSLEVITLKASSPVSAGSDHSSPSYKSS